MFFGERGRVGEENRTKHRNGIPSIFFKHISSYGINPFFLPFGKILLRKENYLLYAAETGCKLG